MTMHAVVTMSEDMRSPKITLSSPPVEMVYDKRRMAVTLEFTSLNEIETLRDQLSAFIAFHRGIETKGPVRHGDVAPPCWISDDGRTAGQFKT